MDPNEAYSIFCRALLEEDKDAAREAYANLRVWIERGGFEPLAFETHPIARRQFFQFNPRSGRIE